jgi:polysaccharide biosynthesis protein PslG
MPRERPALMTRASLALAGLLGALLVASGPTARPAAEVPRGGGDSPFGINAHVATAREFRMLRQAGFRWARVDLTWNWVEAVPGDFRWDEMDRLAADARSEGVHLLGVLGYCPPWASSGPGPYFPPRSQAEWSRYVRAVVGRYRGEIRHWTLWNEPNCGSYFHGTVDQYIRRVLVPGARAVREADPEALVCGPDLAHLSGCDWDAWMGRILAEGGDRFDVITHHCYRDKPDEVFRQLEGPKWPWEPDPVRKILARYGQDKKPFFLTETGWRSDKTGERGQSERCADFLRGAASRPWIRRVFLYELRDSATEPGYGLLRRDYSPKPAYSALKRLIAGSPRGAQGQR